MANPNTKTETIRARVDTALKAEAEAIFAECGLNASEAIRLFYRQVILHRGLPFAVRIPNAETRQAMAEAEAGENLLGPFEDTEQMFRELGM